MPQSREKLIRVPMKAVAVKIKRKEMYSKMKLTGLDNNQDMGSKDKGEGVREGEITRRAGLGEREGCWGC